MSKYSSLMVLLLWCAQTWACEFEQVSFKHDFATGRIDGCQQLSQNRYLLTLKPENSPINNSPWYGFKVVGHKAMSIEVAMTVVDGQHRYPPKVSRDGQQWHLQPHQIEAGQLRFDLDIGRQPIWISAQEPLTAENYFRWGQQLAQKQGVGHDVLGWSVQKRPLYKIETRGKGKEWLVVLGRQHPPEITGAMAMFPFTDTLLADTKLAKQFRQRFNLLVIPNVNPDGVYLGNWRHNANGIDLNRDWREFKQPEVASVHKYLTGLVAQGQQLSMAVDFHSTNRDVFYTMPWNDEIANPGLVSRWLSNLDQQYQDIELEQKPGHNPDLGVFKQYFADNYQAHAITYEMGDNTDRQFIKQFAVSAANELMQTMLATNIDGQDHESE